MDESLIQRCVICGEEICNLNGAMMHPPPAPGDPLPSWPAGSIYTSGNGWPTVLQTSEPKEWVPCKP